MDAVVNLIIGVLCCIDISDNFYPLFFHCTFLETFAMVVFFRIVMLYFYFL